MTQITLLTYGSRGDVQPYIALGRGLQQAGHTVRLAAPGVFEEFVRSYGLDFHPLPGNPAALVQSLVEQNRRIGGMLGSFRAIMAYALPLGMELLEATRAACANADLVVHSFLMTVAGHHLAAERGIPDVSTQLFPVFSETGAFPGPVFPVLPLGARYNRFTHRLFAGSFWYGNRLGYAYYRRKFDLPPLAGWPLTGSQPVPLLYAISPQVLRADDWPPHVHVTGYWFLDTPDWTPPPDLIAFLEAGAPPVYIGFGSTLAEDMDRVTAAALDALKQAGQRGVILSGWARLADKAGLKGEAGSQVYFLDAAPHEWLFPRMAAVVHHGGAGTTAAGLRAGVPSILTPFSSDQPFWGKVVHCLGAGPAPIPYHRLDAHNLAALIREATTSESIRARAAELGAAVRAEDGIGRAVEIIEAHLG